MAERTLKLRYELAEDEYRAHLRWLLTSCQSPEDALLANTRLREYRESKGLPPIDERGNVTYPDDWYSE